MFGRTLNRIWLVVRNYVCCCFSEFANSEPKKEAKEEELEQLKPAIMSEEDHYGVIPILMIGDSTSTLLAEIVDDPEFSANSLKDSAGVDSKIKTVRVNGKTFKLQLFEFSKQEQFKFVRGNYQIKPDAIIIVYDVTAIESFNKARMWLEENEIDANGSVYKLLVGNNYDFDDDDENRVVQKGTAAELAREFRIPFIETSAKNPATLEQALTYMTELIESKDLQN